MAAHDHDKVFAPTSRKRRQAREQGQVVISPDLVGGVLLLAFTAVLHLFGHRLIDATGMYLKGSLAQVRMQSFDGREALASHLVGQLGSAAGYFLVRLWPFWLLPLAVIVTVLIQTRGLIHWPAVAPSLNRINPATGLQRFSLSHIGRRLLGTSFKVAALASIAWFWAVKQHALEAQLDLAHQTQAELDQAVSFLFVLSLGLLAWGVVDYLFRRRRFEQQLKMTARELADEQKQFEPDPEFGRRGQELRTKLAAAVSLNRITDLLITDGLAKCTLLRFDPQTQSVPVIVSCETGPAGVQLLQRCLQSRVTIHESNPLQHELSEVNGQIIPGRLWPQFAELFGGKQTEPIPIREVSEPSTGARVSS